MRAAAETRRTAEWQAAMHRARARRVELIVISAVLMIAFAVAGFFGGRWVQTKRDADKAAAATSTLPDPATVDTPTFTMSFPSIPTREDVPQTIGTVSLPAVGWTLQHGDVSLQLVSIDISSLAVNGVLDPTTATAMLVGGHDSEVNGMATRGSGTVNSTTELTVGGDPARRSEILIVEGHVYVTTVLHGTTVLSFACAATLDAEPAECVDTLASLKWKV